jgi:hypothetical protein
MAVSDLTVAKVQQLPDVLLQEVIDFIDFLLLRQGQTRWQLWTSFTEALGLAENDMADYLANLQQYEEKLARGEISW